MLGTNKEKRKQNGIRRSEKKILRKKRMVKTGGGEKIRRRGGNMGGDDAERNRYSKARKQDTNRRVKICEGSEKSNKHRGNAGIHRK